MDDFKYFLLDLKDDILDFADDHRPLVILAGVLVVLLIIGGVVLYSSINPVKITISSAEEGIGNVIGMRGRTIYLQANATERGKPIQSTYKWEASAGMISVDEEGIVKWNLPTDEGTYSITASNESASATKYITIIGNELSELYKNSSFEVNFQDDDGDGLTNLYEATISKTSQSEKDTDGDGLYDGDEIIMKLDPLKEDSKGDGIKDGQRTLEYTFTNQNVTIDMVGKGNFTRTSVDKYDTETLKNVTAVVDGLFSLYTEATIENAKITIKYDKNLVAQKNLSESSLAVYLLDENKNVFNKIKTDVNTNKGTVSFETETFGKYFIADSSKLTSNLSTELVFVIDNSGSMYSKDEYANSEENDPTFKRVDVVNELVDKLEGNYKFGAGKFTFEYTELAKLTTEKETIKNRVSTIKTVHEKFTGTYIGAGLEGGLSLFTDGDEINRRYVVLLSDGKDSGGEGYNDKKLTEQIQAAQKKNVKVYTIGLGNTIDEAQLKKVASETNGKYYFAATAEDLEDTFGLIAAELNYNLYDTNLDAIDDAVILADSGFMIGRDGFSFSNFSNTQVEHGYGYGMVLYSKLFYEGKLPSRLGTKKITTSSGELVEAPAAEISSLQGVGKCLRTFKPESLSFLADFPINFWAPQVSSGTLAINSEIKSDLSKLGFSTYKVEVADKSAAFKQYESIRFDMDKVFQDASNSDVVDENPLEDSDSGLIKALCRLDITKYRDEKFYFLDNNDTALNLLISELRNGSPIMIRINDDYTVLATKFLADAHNMNKYKIEVYDPNYSGIKKYIEVDRYKFSDIEEISNVVTDTYEYKFKYQGTSVGICLSTPNVYENE